MNYTIKLVLLVSLMILFIPETTSASSNGLVIDEFRTRSLSSTADEYVVLTNFSGSAIDLSGYKLKKLTATLRATTIKEFPTYFLGQAKKIKISPTGGDFSYSGSLLADTNNAIVLYDPANNPVDAVTYGTVNDFPGKEGFIPLIEKAIPYQRINGRDTNNNVVDFTAVRPNPTSDANLEKVILSELLPNPKSGDEWFEIYNPTASRINLFGLTACDLKGSIHCYPFPSESIDPHGYRAYDQNKTKITLNDDADGIVLKNSSGKVICSSGIFNKASNGISYALINGSWKWTSHSTKSAKNIYAPVAEETASKTKEKKNSTNESNISSIEPSSRADLADSDSTVKAAQTKAEAAKIGRKEVGYVLIIIAAALVIGYTIFENREKTGDYYHKLRHRNG